MSPIIIAEIGWNHMGDMNIAKQMIKEASASGAHFAKFQTWKVERLTNGEWDKDGRRSIYEKAELSEKDHIELISYCENYGIKFMSSAFSVADAELLKKLNCNYVKVPSFEVSNIDLLYYCKNNFKNIYVSTGTASENEIKELEKIFNNWNGSLIVMHCVSAYPCEANSINLPRINHLKKYFQNVGFSDHTQGIMSTIASLNFKPNAIEKHFTIDKNLPGRDNKFAILPHEMNFLTTYIKNKELSEIDHGINYQDIEITSRKEYRGRFNA